CKAGKAGVISRSWRATGWSGPNTLPEAIRKIRAYPIWPPAPVTATRIGAVMEKLPCAGCGSRTNLSMIDSGFDDLGPGPEPGEHQRHLAGEVPGTDQEDDAREEHGGDHDEHAGREVLGVATGLRRRHGPERREELAEAAGHRILVAEEVGHLPH